MEQIQQLFEILKSTPEMALWGMSIYFFFILAKLASWVSALAYVSKLFINRYFDTQKDILKQKPAQRIIDAFNEAHVSETEERQLLNLIEAIRRKSGVYIHSSDMKKAIEAIEISDKFK